MMNNMLNEPTPDYGVPIFRLGFRAFFLAGGLFSVLSMMIWMGSYVFAFKFHFAGIEPSIWHAHEMLFGYSMAVVAGFLLTAIKNWTGVDVLRGTPLMLLLCLWIIARILPISGLNPPIALIAMFDVLFLFMLFLVCLIPIIKSGQYKHMGIISKLFLLMLCNVLFYLGLADVVEDGVRWGLYSALYMIIALVLVMMRRVMPMFIKNGVGNNIEIKNHAWVDIASLVFLISLWLLDVFIHITVLTELVAAVLTGLHSFRLYGWYTNKIWRKPLVWVLVVAYAFFILGFALKALPLIYPIPPFLYVHAFTVGGIGLVTIGMMSRVSLGHTGRNVFEPPLLVFWSLFALLIGAVVRVIFPLFSMDFYTYWIGISQVLWIISFSLFLFIYTPMFFLPRIDERDS